MFQKKENRTIKFLKKLMIVPIIWLITLSAVNPIVMADIFMTEVMYDPGDTLGDLENQWIELYNSGSETENLSDWEINGFRIENLSIGAGEFAILTGNIAAFDEFYGNNDTVWNISDADFEVANFADGFEMMTEGNEVLNLAYMNGTIIDMLRFNNSFNNNITGHSIEKLNLLGELDNIANYNELAFENVELKGNYLTFSGNNLSELGEGEILGLNLDINGEELGTALGISETIDDARIEAWLRGYSLGNDVEDISDNFDIQLDRIYSKALELEIPSIVTNDILTLTILVTSKDGILASVTYPISIGTNWEASVYAGTPGMHNDDTTPVFNPIPTNQTFEYGTSILYDINAEDFSGIDTYTINDTILFAISADGEITNIGMVPVGEHMVLVSVNDTIGNTNNSYFAIDIEDTTSPVWMISLQDRTIEHGDAFSYHISAIDLSGIDAYSINDSDFTINSTGHIGNTTDLPVGDFPVTVTAADPYGNSLDGSFIVTVEDTVAPVWDIAPENRIIELGTPFSMQINATDIHGIELYEVDNTAFMIDSTGLVENATSLIVAEYIITLSAYDIYGNELSEVSNIAVIDTTAPAWNITPENQTFELGNAIVYDVEASDLGGIDRYEIDNTLFFAISADGEISNTAALDVGSYSIEITAFDDSQNSVSENMTIIIEDTVAPVFTVALVDQVVEYGNDLFYDIDATDFSTLFTPLLWAIGSYDAYIMPTVEISQDGEVSNIADMPLGDFNMMISATDASGNMVQDNFTLTVQDTISPIASITLNQTTVEYGYEEMTASFDVVELLPEDNSIDVAYPNGTSLMETDNLADITLTPFELNTLGEYTVDLYADDTSANSDAVTANFTVVDRITPEISNVSIISHESGSNIIYNTGDVEISATVTDLLLEGVSFDIDYDNDGTYDNFTGIEVSPDVYNYTIDSSMLEVNQTVGWKVFGIDTSGNTAEYIRNFTVVNRVPVFIDTIPDMTWEEDVNAVIDMRDYFMDYDDDVLTYQMIGNTDIAMTSNYTHVTLDPNTDWSGTNTVNFRAVDPFGSVSEYSNDVLLTVTGENDAPRYAAGAIPTIVFDEDSYNDSLVLSDYIVDPDGDSSLISYTFSKNESNVLYTFDNATTALNITSTPDWYGNGRISIFAEDEDGMISTFNFKTNTSSVNDAPVAIQVANINLDEDFGTWTIDLALFESDVDPYDVDENLSWEISGLNPGLVDSEIDNMSDILTLDSINDVYGNDEFTLSLIDSLGEIDNISLWLNIAPVNDEPYISPSIPDQATPEDHTLIVDLTGYGHDVEDGTGLTWQVLGADPSIWHSVQVVGDTATFMPIYEVSNISDIVQFRVSDSEGAFAEQDVTMTIDGEEDAPSPFNLIAPNTGASIQAQSVEFTWTESVDNDGDAVSYILSLTDNNSNAFQWDGLTTESYVFNAVQNSTEYTWNVIATDGMFNTTSGTRTFTTPESLIPNSLPVFDAIADMDAVEDTEMSFMISGSDADNQTLTFSTTEYGFAFTPINDTHANAAWTPENNDVGINTITFTVSDGIDTVDQIVEITVANTNDAPVFETVDDVSVIFGELLTIDLDATDVDETDNLSYSTGFAFGTIDADTGIFTWTPLQSQIGDYNATFEVTDGIATDSAIVGITVTIDNDAPVIISYSPNTAATVYIADGVDQSFTINADDADGDSLTTTWRVDGTDVETDDGNSAQYTFNSASSGLFDIEAEVSDSMIGSGSQGWTVNVTEVPITFDYSGTIGSVQESEVSNMAGLTISNSNGRIDFGAQLIDLSDIALIDSAIMLNNGQVGLDTGRYPTLNAPATVTLYGLEYETTPVIYYNMGFSATGTNVCSPSRCSNIVYDNATGTLTMEVTGFSTYFTSEDVDLENGLFLKISDVEVEGEENDNDELRVGERFTVTVEIDNDADFDIEDIDLVVRIEDSDGDVLEDIDDKDMEEDSNFDLDEGDDERDLKSSDYKFTFTLPYDLDDGDEFTVYVEAEGYNADDGTKVRDVDTSESIEIKKEKHEVSIDKLYFIDSEVSCDDNANLKLQIRNTGKNSEDVEIEIRSTELGFILDDDVELDEDADDDDNVYTRTYSLDLLDGIAPGAYPVQVIIEYDDGDEKMTEFVYLTIGTCRKSTTGTGTESTVTQGSSDVELRPYSNLLSASQAAKPVNTVNETSFKDSDEYLMLLIIVIILIFGMIGAATGFVLYRLK